MEEICDDEFRESMTQNNMTLFQANIQAPASAIAVWLLGAHAETIDLRQMTAELRNHPNFRHLPVNVRKMDLKIRRNEQSKSGKKVSVVVVETSKDEHILAEVIRQCLLV